MNRARALAALLLIAACHARREAPEPAETYEELAPLLDGACRSCHGGDAPAAGYSVDGYLATIGCTEDGRPVTSGAAPPLLTALDRADHAGLVSDAQRTRLRGWLERGAPAFRGTVHDASIIDPRSPGWHGTLVAADRFRLLRDATSENACGRCHDGMPVRPAGFTSPAPDAPACTSCHDSPQGVLACDTCHGRAGEAPPPRDPCYFGPARQDAHRAHLHGTRFTSEPLACASCHPVPGDDLFTREHADGAVDVRVSDPRAGAQATYDAEDEQCSVACHAQGGRATTPAWYGSAPVDCQSCHLSPPAEHYPGTCDTCHVDMGEDATSLTPGHFHLDGQVELGDGSGTCGACHGASSSGAPGDASHALHLNPRWTDTLTCDACHETPERPVSPGHMDGAVGVRFGARASARGQMPTFDAATKRCANVACHGAGLPGAPPTPRWGDGRTTTETCAGCHMTPPPSPHVQRDSCGGGLCHGDEVGGSTGGLTITESGRPRHIDGTIQAGP